MKLTVTFTSQGRMLEAALFLPPQSQSDLVPAFLFEGSMTGATTQLTEYIARELSNEGFICMILDHSFYGDDESAAQAWESPAKRVEDIKAGLKFLSQQAAADEDSLIGVGVSVGAEYLARAIQETTYCKGFVMIQGPFDDSQNYVGSIGIPAIVIDENNLDAAVDEMSLWARTLFGGAGQVKGSSRDSLVDWSLSEK